MIGSTNLQEVLNSIEITCDDIEYGFATVPASSPVQVSDILGCFMEDEGLTLFAGTEYFRKHNIAFEGPFARLTIQVHTSLELVGLTAALAKQLTVQQISANVIAAFYHDHIFVQFDQREKAIDALLELRNR